MSVLPARRRVALLVALVAAWVAGSALGATQPARHAAAAPLFQHVARYAIQRLGIEPSDAVGLPPHALPAP